VTHFVEIFGQQMGTQIKHFPPETMVALSLYDWPGNIREPQNLIQRAVILSNFGVLPHPLPKPRPHGVIPRRATTGLREPKRTLILRALEAVSWLIGGLESAAAKLRLTRMLTGKMQKPGSSRRHANRENKSLEAHDASRHYSSVRSPLLWL
jgi:formate hydrogenlyase transcriptional activator